MTNFYFFFLARATLQRARRSGLFFVGSHTLGEILVQEGGLQDAQVVDVHKAHVSQLTAVLETGDEPGARGDNAVQSFDTNMQLSLI